MTIASCLLASFLYGLISSWFILFPDFLHPLDTRVLVPGAWQVFFYNLAHADSVVFLHFQDLRTLHWNSNSSTSTSTMVEKHNPGDLSRQSTLRQAAGVPDGFNYTHDNASSPLDLGASNEAPPAYGDVHDQLNLSQDGFNAGAAVTGELQPWN